MNVGSQPIPKKIKKQIKATTLSAFTPIKLFCVYVVLVTTTRPIMVIIIDISADGKQGSSPLQELNKVFL
jgi:hypothetical protein